MGSARSPLTLLPQSRAATLLAGGDTAGPERAAKPHCREEPGAALRFRPGGSDLSGRDKALCAGGEGAAAPCGRQVGEGRCGGAGGLRGPRPQGWAGV